MAAPPAAAASGNDQIARENLYVPGEYMNLSLISVGPQHDFKKGAHWLHASPYLPPDWETTSSVGASSLKHSAMRVFMSDQSILLPEHFEIIPWHIAKYIWESMQQCGKRTMWLWKMFVTNYAEFRAYSPIYHLRIEVPAQPLVQYFKIMNSDECHWGGVLRVGPNITDAQNLVALGNIKNLVALEMIAPEARIRTNSNQPPPDSEAAGVMEDSVVRSWMEMALSHGCFKHLRIIRLFNQNRITPNILWMLEKMPALELIVVSHCWNFTRAFSDMKYKRGGVPVQGWMARRFDYLHQEDSNFEDNRMRIVGPLLAAYRMSVDEGTKPLPQGKSDSGRRPNHTTVAAHIPLLEFQLPCTQNHQEDPLSHLSHRVLVEDRCTFVFHRGSEPAPKKRPFTLGSEHGQRREIKKGLKKRDLTEFLDDFLV